MLKPLLYLASVFYGLAVFIRNKLFDYKFMESKEFEIPVISIGNITVGGTGKTPHTEYLVNLLSKHFKVVTVSRGYKRMTNGYLEVNTNSSFLEVGDEPLQIKNKFSDIQVIVDEKRVHAIQKIQEQDAEKIPDVILLDDAYQHRSVSPGINILLIDFNNPIKDDFLLPYGRLREGVAQMFRANIIIYTKCPEEILPITRRIIMKDVNLRPYQNLYFTTMKYDDPKPVFPKEAAFIPDLDQERFSILLVTGIANPAHLKKYLSSFSDHMVNVQFPDHHSFTEDDIRLVEQKFIEIGTQQKIIITTEKDSMRLKEIELSPLLKENMFFIPVRIQFLGSEGKHFDEKIVNYVRENKSNRELHRRKNQQVR